MRAAGGKFFKGKGEVFKSFSELSVLMLSGRWLSCDDGA